LNAAVFIVWHLSPYSTSLLPEILNRASKLKAKHPDEGEPIQMGKIYIAPPDHHLLLESGRIRLTKGPKENRFRPAIDPLFRSAAYAYGSRVVGVVLTGALDDGTAGLWAIKDRGGVAVVQDPADAEQPSMPASALANVQVDHCLPISEIPALLVTLTHQSAEEESRATVSKDLEIETKIALGDDAAELDVKQLGEVSEFTCPDCHGTLVEVTNDKLLRFRCHTGHSFGSASLLAELTDSVEESLWNAIRAVEERIRLLKHLAQHATDLEQTEAIGTLDRELQENERRADLLRQAAMLDSKNGS
ncbi:MAG TPA: chemotaxis protein CheB, partial [Candidatus Binatia bacterium]|nr:chemotaxis protein CheB [Candidatus Binatia bacterium]